MGQRMLWYLIDCHLGDLFRRGKLRRHVKPTDRLLSCSRFGAVKCRAREDAQSDVAPLEIVTQYLGMDGISFSSEETDISYSILWQLRSVLPVDFDSRQDRDVISSAVTTVAERMVPQTRLHITVPGRNHASRRSHASPT
jgi:hypothetical protein